MFSENNNRLTNNKLIFHRFILYTVHVDEKVNLQLFLLEYKKYLLRMIKSLHLRNKL